MSFSLPSAIRAAPLRPWRGAARALSTARDAHSLPAVLLLDDIELANSELEQLKQKANVVRSQSTSRQGFIEEVNSLKNVQALYRHFGGARSIKITGRFDQELVGSLPPSLKFLCHNGAGYDQLDVAALTKKGIQASNVPTAVDDATSTTALWLMIGALRAFALAQSQLSHSFFNSRFPFLDAHDPGSSGGKVLGIVGAGGIGRALARKATALGMRVIYHNRNRLDAATEAAMCPQSEAAEYVSTLDELLSRSDVVSLHCPLSPQTKGLIGKSQLKTMKQTAVLINTARGPVVDEAALADALEDGTIAGAGLDVFEKEPQIHPKILSLSQNGTGKALILPHVGTLTRETQTEMEAVCLRNIMHGLHTGKLSFTVAEQRASAAFLFMDLTELCRSAGLRAPERVDITLPPRKKSAYESDMSDKEEPSGSILHAPAPKREADTWSRMKLFSPMQELRRLGEGKVPCARQSLLQGIATFAVISSVGLISRRSMVSSMNWGTLSFLAVSLVSFETCRQARKEEARRMKIVREDFKRRRPGQAASPSSGAAALPERQ